MTRIITFNANGIRAAEKKGFFSWFARQKADILCVQETKAQHEQIRDNAAFFPKGYESVYYDAEKKGYSGTAVYYKKKPAKITKGLGWHPADSEGRWICLEYPKVNIASLYMPSGSSGEERQKVKFKFLDAFYKNLKSFDKGKKPFIICADWNICHKEIDLENWKSNQKNSGFLPEERAWLDKVYDELGWYDGFRLVNQKPKQYTWWSARGNARANNVGWRLDYPIISPTLKAKIKAVKIYTDKPFSDHAPVLMDYTITL